MRMSIQEINVQYEYLDFFIVEILSMCYNLI
jgi:hypothetical protein